MCHGEPSRSPVGYAQQHPLPRPIASQQPDIELDGNARFSYDSRNHPIEPSLGPLINEKAQPDSRADRELGIPSNRITTTQIGVHFVTVPLEGSRLYSSEGFVKSYAPFGPNIRKQLLPLNRSYDQSNYVQNNKRDKDNAKRIGVLRGRINSTILLILCMMVISFIPFVTLHLNMSMNSYTWAQARRGALALTSVIMNGFLISRRYHASGDSDTPSGGLTGAFVISVSSLPACIALLVLQVIAPNAPVYWVLLLYLSALNGLYLLRSLQLLTLASPLSPTTVNIAGGFIRDARTHCLFLFIVVGDRKSVV